MCGVVAGSSPNPTYLRNLNRALEKIQHRGPDGLESIAFDDVFLGHVRLSIVDLTGGTQPIANETETVWACVNGEFYGHEALRRGLERRDHRFRTQSDSEILLHLYEEHGVDCLAQLHGEFAFVLYDKRLRRWFCARDRMGVRPLQYYRQGPDFLVASEAKALFALGVPARLDRDSLWFSQHLQYLPQNGTLFADVHMLPPAHYLLVDAAGLQVQRYWTLNNVPEQVVSFEEAQERAAALIQQAVARRIPNEVAWACHLSGGIDSSIVSALAQQHPGRGHCFTVRFTDDAFYDESPFARETARHIGATLHEVEVDFGAILKALPSAVFHAEGLSINGHLGAKYLLNQAMRAEGFKVALTGEGADEIFMGYSHLKQDYLSAAALTGMEQQYLCGFQLPSGSTLDLSGVHKRLGFVPTWLAAKSSMAFKLQQLWHPSFRLPANPYEQLLDEAEVASLRMSNLKKSSLLWMQYCLTGYILKVLDDAQALAHGIEGRLPFLDTELMEFMWSVPDTCYFHEGVEKGLLRRGFAAHLPASVIAKTKQSFMSPPVSRALQHPAYTALVQQYLLDNPRFEAQQVIDRHALEQFLQQCQTQDSPRNEPLLMTLLSLAILCDQFQL